MEFQQWAVDDISKLISLDQESLEEIVNYTQTLPEAEASENLRNLLGDSPAALEFIAAFNRNRPGSSAFAAAGDDEKSQTPQHDSKAEAASYAPPDHPPPMSKPPIGNSDGTEPPSYAPPSGPPPSLSGNGNGDAPVYAPPPNPPPPSSSNGNGNAPNYAPPAHPVPSASVSAALRRPHTNAVIEAAHVRAKDEVRFTTT